LPPVSRPGSSARCSARPSTISARARRDFLPDLLGVGVITRVKSGSAAICLCIFTSTKIKHPHFQIGFEIVQRFDEGILLLKEPADFLEIAGKPDSAVRIGNVATRATIAPSSISPRLSGRRSAPPLPEPTALFSATEYRPQMRDYRTNLAAWRGMRPSSNLRPPLRGLL
jgi:hypothetical protein